LRQADDAESNHRWPAAAFHLNQLVAQEPPTASLVIRRARARLNSILAQPAEDGHVAKLLEFPAKLEDLATDDPLWWCCDREALLAVSEGQREKLIEILTAALESGPNDPDWWTLPAAAALAAGNPARHQEICRQILTYYSGELDAPIARRFLTIFLANAELDADLGAARSRLGARVAAEFVDAAHLVGAVRYRERKYQEALELFAPNPRHVGEDDEEDEEEEPPRAWDFLFLAMIQHRLGHIDESRELLRRGRDWIDSNPKIEWTEKVTNAELRRQAEALIVGNAR
jgi:tetratricopeptide (TPR) repeat protein